MLATALALCAFGAALPATGDDVAAVVTVLERNADPSRTDERLALELEALGPLHLPDLFAVLAYGPAPERALASREEEALLGALASFGSVSVRTFLRQRLATEASPEERLAALRVLARAGTGEDLVLVRKAMQPLCGGLVDALGEASTGILRRDARALESVRRWMLEAPLEAASALAHAVAASDCAGATEALARSLGFRAEIDGLLLDELAPLLGRAGKPLGDEILAPLEDTLRGDDPRVLRAAAVALGKAQDAGALPRLIELLEHEGRGVRAAVEGALADISGLHLRTDAERWRAWLRAEQAWLEQEGPRLRTELADLAPEVAIGALGELSCHRWRRHELALEATVALKHADPRVRSLACTVLARLGSTAAGPALLVALEDEDETVGRAAREALQVLGLMPADPSGRGTAFFGRTSRNRFSRSRKRRLA